MGKSLGNTLEPKELVARYGSDAVRYFFLKEIEFGKDGDFAEERFINMVNANLANTIGRNTGQRGKYTFAYIISHTCVYVCMCVCTRVCMYMHVLRGWKYIYGIGFVLI